MRLYLDDDMDGIFTYPRAVVAAILMQDTLNEGPHMPQTITLTLPDDIFQPVQRTAHATQQSVEALLLTA